MSAQLATVGTPAHSPVSNRVSVLVALARPERLALLSSICTSLVDASSMAPPDVVSRHGDALILIEQGMSGWDQLLLLLAVERPASAVIVISDNLPAHMVRALMKFRASDILSGSATPSDISESAARLSLVADVSEIPSASPGSSACWAFRGAVGGAGVSTLAIESAFAFARASGPGKVCLVDLNLADGMTTSFLEAVPKLDLAALAAAPERLDQRLLAAWCWQHERGVSIIASARNPDADMLASEGAILRLLDVACATFPIVILDMPRHRMPWTQPVLSAVDEAIIVSELTVPSLHAAADMCRDIDVLRGDRCKARLVLNRMFQKKRFRTEFAIDKAEQAIERKIDATITSDWDAARTAVNLGKPIADVKPKSPVVGDVASLVRLFAPDGLITENTAASRKKKSFR